MPTPTLDQLNAAVTWLFNEMQKRGVVLSGEADPTTEGGIIAPITAEYVQTTDTGIQIARWQKFGTDPTEWGQIPSVGGGGINTPFLIAADETADATWSEKTGHIITGPAEITLPLTTGLTPTYDAPDGYSFGLCCECAPAGVTIVREDAGVIKTKFGDVTVVGFAHQNAFIAITQRDDEWFAVGELTDESP